MQGRIYRGTTLLQAFFIFIITNSNHIYLINNEIQIAKSMN